MLWPVSWRVLEKVIGVLLLLSRCPVTDSGSTAAFGMLRPASWFVSGRVRDYKCLCASRQGSGEDGGGLGARSRREIVQLTEPGQSQSSAAMPSQSTLPALPRRPRGPSPAQVLLNKRLTRCDSPDAVMLEIHSAEASGLMLTPVNTVTAMHRLAKTSAAGRTLVQGDVALLLERIDHELAPISAAPSSMLDDRAITTLAWSLGSLYHTLSDVRPSRKHAQSFARAELCEHLGRTLRLVLSQLHSRHLSQMPAQGLSNVAWACAKCNLQGEAVTELLDRIADVLTAGRAEQTWNPQDLSNLAWAYGRLRSRSSAFLIPHRDLAALNAMSTAALKLGLRLFQPQALSNMLWAHARLAAASDRRGGSAALSEAICEEAAARRELRGFSSQEVSNLAWAATVIDGSLRESLCSAIGTWLARSDSRLHYPQEVSIMLWAFAKTQAACPILVGRLWQRIEEEPEWLAEFSCQALSNVVWALAKLQRLNTVHAHAGEYLKASCSSSLRPHTLVAQGLQRLNTHCVRTQATPRATPRATTRRRRLERCCAKWSFGDCLNLNPARSRRLFTRSPFWGGRAGRGLRRLRQGWWLPLSS